MSSLHAALIEASQKMEAVYKVKFKSGKFSQNAQRTQSYLCFNCGGKWLLHGGKNTCPAVGKTCNNCDKHGHFSKVCRLKFGQFLKR